MKKSESSSDRIERDFRLMQRYIYRGGKGDYERYSRLSRRLEKPLLMMWNEQRDGVKSRRRHAGRMYADFLFEKAQGLYLNERDAEALAAYQKCLDFVIRNGIPFPDRRDVAHKIASLQYVLSPNGLRKAEALLSVGRVVNAWSSMRKPISAIGLNYLDHRVMILAAVLCWLNSRYGQSRRFIDADMNTGGDRCMETLFVYAIIHLVDQRAAAMRILRRISDPGFVGKCRIGHETRSRIIDVALSILSLRMQRRTGRAVFDLGGEVVMVGLDVVQRAALKYVECAKSAKWCRKAGEHGHDDSIAALKALESGEVNEMGGGTCIPRPE